MGNFLLENVFIYMCEVYYFVWSVKSMFSPEFTKFLMNYQEEYKEQKPEKQYIHFKQSSGVPVRVAVLVRK